MKSRKASVNVKRKVYTEYVLPVMVYGSETLALKMAHTELAVPDLGLGTLGTCPGASTRKGLHKSRH